MRTICLSEEAIALLENLDAPFEVCDESGHLIGLFNPEPRPSELLPVSAPVVEVLVHAEDLGPEMCVYGFEADLE